MTSGWQHGFEGGTAVFIRGCGSDWPREVYWPFRLRTILPMHVCALTWLHGFPESNGAMRKHRGDGRACLSPLKNGVKRHWLRVFGTRHGNSLPFGAHMYMR